jgi:hypothetical protein
MNSLPTELNLTILHHVRDSTPTVPFGTDASASMEQANTYNEFLLLIALLHRHWTALAQSELFHHIILEDGDKTRLLLELLKESGNGVFRTYADRASSSRLGYHGTGSAQDYDCLGNHLESLAEYCPNIVEISCACVNTKPSDFSEPSPVHAQAKLIKSISRRKYQEARQAKPLRREPRWIRLLLTFDHEIISRPLSTVRTPVSLLLSTSSSSDL